MAAGKAAAVESNTGFVSLAELTSLPLPFEDIPLDEYDGKALRLYAVTGAERQRLVQLQREGETADPDERTARVVGFQHELIASSLGAPATPEEVAKLPSTVIDKLSKVALQMAGIGGAAVDTAEQELKATPSDDSGSS